MVLTLHGEYDHAIHDFETGLESERLNGRDGESYAFVRFVQGDCTATDDLQTLRRFGTCIKLRPFDCYPRKWRCIGIAKILIWRIKKQSVMASQFPGC